MRSRRLESFSWFLVIVALFALTLSGCESARPAPGTGGMSTMGAGTPYDVKVVTVQTSGAVSPDPVQLRRGRQVAVWELAGDGTLSIHFTGDNPFDQQPTCNGRFCFALTPPPAGKEPKRYPYTASVTAAGQTQAADPDVEVIP